MSFQISVALPAQGGELALVNRDAGDGSGQAICVAGEKERPVSGEGCPTSEKLGSYAESVSAAGIKAIREDPDEDVIQKIQADSVKKLLTPKLSVSEVPESVVQMVKAMTLYFSGASFSQIGVGLVARPKARCTLGL